MRQEVLHGDSLLVLPTLEADSIDAICCDPPYELGLLNRGWDSSGIAFSVDLWREALRVAKPGAHLIAFGGTRTVHRLMVAIEDAGWEIRDLLVWAYAQGMPKDGDLSIDVDRMLGAKREVIGSRPVTNANLSGRDMMGDGTGTQAGTVPILSGPVTEEAKRAEGWSTTLKPAWEPAVLARKPFRGNVPRNFLAYGTGALNIGATRIPIDPGDPVHDAVWTSRPGVMAGYGHMTNLSRDGERTAALTNPAGRWPSNVMLTDPIFDGGLDGVEGGGEAKGATNGWAKATEGEMLGGLGGGPLYGDSGTYSRFFLVPKASKSDREPDMDALQQLGINPLRGTGGSMSGPMGASRCVACGLRQPFASACSKCGATDLETYTPEGITGRVNTHPTVKPRELMRHLIRLITPPGGTVLDPFAGSGTTAIVADQEGFGWVAIELDEAHVQMIRTRLLGTQRGLGL